MDIANAKLYDHDPGFDAWPFIGGPYDGCWIDCKGLIDDLVFICFDPDVDKLLKHRHIYLLEIEEKDLGRVCLRYEGAKEFKA